jgi:hypothetical protein
MQDITLDQNNPQATSKATEKASIKKTSRSNTPNDDINLAAVALRTAHKWADYPQITLILYNQSDFLAKAMQFNTLVQQRVVEQQNRPTLTRSTKQLEADIKVGLKVVRGYLFEKYKDETKARLYYSDFGLENKGKFWGFPTDQQRILVALQTLQTGIVTHGFDAKDFGTNYWADLAANYTTAVQTAVTNDGSSSTTVFQKETLKKEIKAIMVALRGVIRGNYGTGANAILRDLGFQKEKV